MTSVELREVDKVYESGVHAVRNLELTAEAGELLVLLGPSGCGKSTILRLVAGLESLSSGEIHVGGRRVDTEPPQRRDVAMVFQNYALYGHMTVRQNLEFPLRMRGERPKERRRRAEAVAELLELGSHLDVRPAALSGGQQQRVAMGRALVRDPRAFLLDEPLSNLDARLRGQVRTHIAQIQERLGVTTLYVTHDQVEALSLGHRVAVLRDGRLQQIGLGQHLYDRPANAFVGQFLGQPGMNLIVGRLERSERGLIVDVGAGAWSLSDWFGARAVDLTERIGEQVIVGVRPESLEIAAPSGASTTTVSGEVRTVEALGSERVLHVASLIRTVDASTEFGASAPAGDGGPLLAVRTATSSASVGPGDAVALRAAPERLRLFDAEGNALAG